MSDWTFSSPVLHKFGLYTAIRALFLTAVVFNYLYVYQVKMFNFLPLYQVAYLGYYFFLISMGFYPVDMLIGIVDQIPYWVVLGRSEYLALKWLGSLNSMSSLLFLGALWIYSFYYHRAHDKHQQHQNQEHYQHHEIKEKGFLAFVVCSYFGLYLIKYLGRPVHPDYLQDIVTETYYDLVILIYVVYCIKGTVHHVQHRDYFWVIAFCIWITAALISGYLRVLLPSPEGGHKSSSDDFYPEVFRTLYLLLNNIFTIAYLMVGAHSFWVFVHVPADIEAGPAREDTPLTQGHGSLYGAITLPRDEDDGETI